MKSVTWSYTFISLFHLVDSHLCSVTVGMNKKEADLTVLKNCEVCRWANTIKKEFCLFHFIADSHLSVTVGMNIKRSRFDMDY